MAVLYDKALCDFLHSAMQMHKMTVLHYLPSHWCVCPYQLCCMYYKQQIIAFLQV
jgi:hypothetical protein